MQKVVVAMSGGVDSSVAAALLKEEGYEVLGIMLQLWSEDSNKTNKCCSTESTDSAREIADILNIPFYLIDCEAPFKNIIVDYFVDTYITCATPNPCPVCNKRIRFGFLLEQAKALGAQLLASGHYARILKQNDLYLLNRGVDPDKDQSYVLYQLNQKQLSHLIFPLGRFTKTEVRQIANELGLPVFSKPDSQDLCFTGEKNYRVFLKKHSKQLFKSGPIFDLYGKQVGEHHGLPFYTIGQRTGIGIAFGKPYYVVDIVPEKNALIVGEQHHRFKKEFYISDSHYITGSPPENPIPISVKVRYTGKESKAVLNPLSSNTAKITSESRILDITPGQSAVFYQGQCLIGGGIITKPDSA